MGAAERPPSCRGGMLRPPGENLLLLPRQDSFIVETSTAADPTSALSLVKKHAWSYFMNSYQHSDYYFLLLLTKVTRETEVLPLWHDMKKKLASIHPLITPPIHCTTCVKHQHADQDQMSLTTPALYYQAELNSFPQSSETHLYNFTYTLSTL